MVWPTEEQHRVELADSNLGRCIRTCISVTVKEMPAKILWKAPSVIERHSSRQRFTEVSESGEARMHHRIDVMM